MKNLKKLRKKWGLTQLDLAELLNLKQNHLSMVEKNERTLPTKALIKLAELQKRFDSENNYTENPFANQENIAAFYENDMKSCHYKASLLEKRLENMGVRYQYLLNEWEHLQKVVQISELSKERKLKVIKKCRLIEREIQKKGLVKQAELSLQIKALRFREEEAKKMITVVA